MTFHGYYTLPSDKNYEITTFLKDVHVGLFFNFYYKNALEMIFYYRIYIFTIKYTIHWTMIFIIKCIRNDFYYYFYIGYENWLCCYLPKPRISKTSK